VGGEVGAVRGRRLEEVHVATDRGPEAAREQSVLWRADFDERYERARSRRRREGDGVWWPVDWGWANHAVARVRPRIEQERFAHGRNAHQPATAQVDDIFRLHLGLLNAIAAPELVVQPKPIEPLSDQPTLQERT